MDNRKYVNYQLIIRHLLFWSGYILLEAVTYGWEDTDALSFHLSPNVLTVVLPVTILITYINLYILIPHIYNKRQYYFFAFSVLVLLFCGGLFIRFLTHIFVLPWEAAHDPQRYALEDQNFWIPVRILRISLSFIPVVVITMFMEVVNLAYNSEKRQREKEREAHRTEIDFLKAQINPHFYFNTLNSLYALTLKGSENASQLVLKLSSLMHYMLYESVAERVGLEHDIANLENYLDIERLRFADRLELSFMYSGDIQGKTIAPLVMMPFVENAFKHGLKGDSDWITIDITVGEIYLFLKVENSYSGLQSAPSAGGLGIRNVKRRLELLYPGKYQLELNQDNDIYQAQLRLEL